MFSAFKKVVQLVQIGGGGGNLDKIQNNSSFSSWNRPFGKTPLHHHHYHQHHQKNRYCLNPSFSWFWFEGPMTFKNQNIWVFILFEEFWLQVHSSRTYLQSLLCSDLLQNRKPCPAHCTVLSPLLSQITIFTASTNLFRALMGRQPPTAEFCTFPTSGCCSPRWLSLLRGPTFLHLTHFKPRHSLT